MVYLLETLVWQQTKDAKKKNPQERPTQFIPDFLKTGDHTKEAEAHTTEDIKDILSRPRN